MSHQFSSWKNKLILFEKCNQSCGMKKLFQISHQYSSWTQETSDQKAMWTITWGLNISAHHVYIGLSKKELSKFTNMQFIKNKNRFHIRFVYNFLEKIVFWIKIIILVHGTNKPYQCEKFNKSYGMKNYLKFHIDTVQVHKKL